MSSKVELELSNKKFSFYSIEKLDAKLRNLPKTLKVLLENNLYNKQQTGDIFLNWLNSGGKYEYDLEYLPTRVLMQDFTGVPAVVDLAAMRDALKSLGGDPGQINPACQVDLVIDHSVQVDEFGHDKAISGNMTVEMLRNRERYKFLNWGQKSFDNFRVVPPGIGICHQVNIEHLATVVSEKSGVLFSDTVVGTDSHTTMVNGMGVLGWGVGGIEAEAVMLGQPISIKMPEVIGVRLIGKLSKIATATDMVLTLTNLLRSHGVVGKFVEFFGEGLSGLSLADRATIANMAPEYGATCGFSPVDSETINYLHQTARSEFHCKLVEAYAKAQGLWASDEPVFTEVIEFDLSTVKPCMAGPKRPQDKVFLNDIPNVSASKGKSDVLSDGDVVIAAITSCTNTSNPAVMIAAGMLAKAAKDKGLKAKPWVKCSLAPGSKVVISYLEKLGLLAPLADIGFHLVGYGCTTCIGNSGPLADDVTQEIKSKGLKVSGVLSGNRNFEGRIHPLVRDNWLASPPLVVAYAIAGSTGIDLTSEPIAQNDLGEDVYLHDLWPEPDALNEFMSVLDVEMFQSGYKNIYEGDLSWQQLSVNSETTYSWQQNSTYVRKPTFFDNMSLSVDDLSDIKSANILAILGDSVTTDHISPAGVIQSDSPAGAYLKSSGVDPKDFNSYGSRRGNHEVMMRGTFANIRIKNQMLPGVEGGFTKYIPTGELMPIYDAAMRYSNSLVIFAGEEYGTGSSRDWAAKGTSLLGVKCVIAKSFERIHRSNLIGMGVLPCEIADFDLTELKGDEKIDIIGLQNMEAPGEELTLVIRGETERRYKILSRIDTVKEFDYFLHGGILRYVVRQKLLEV